MTYTESSVSIPDVKAEKTRTPPPVPTKSRKVVQRESDRRTRSRETRGGSISERSTTTAPAPIELLINEKAPSTEERDAEIVEPTTGTVAPRSCFAVRSVSVSLAVAMELCRAKVESKTVLISPNITKKVDLI